jgi:hypothetical protein
VRLQAPSALSNVEWYSKTMARRKYWKPIHRLGLRDFEHRPVWGFDLNIEGEDGADETWVRPYVFRVVPQKTDTLFFAATVRPRNGRARRGMLVGRFTNSTPKVDAVALFRPYRCFTCREGFLPEGELETMERMHPGTKNLFPLRYDAVVRAGGISFEFAGQLRVGS